MFSRRGHGNGHNDHATYNYKIKINFCKVDGHTWHLYNLDPTQEFCSVCGKFRNKEGEK